MTRTEAQTEEYVEDVLRDAPTLRPDQSAALATLLGGEVADDA